MTQKIFYNPETLQIMGASVGTEEAPTAPVTMDFPYLESETLYFSLENLAVKMIDGRATLTVT